MTDNYARAYARHNGRANVLTISGSANSVEQDDLVNYYGVLTWGAGKHYSVRIGAYMLSGGSSFTPIDCSWY